MKAILILDEMPKSCEECILDNYKYCNGCRKHMRLPKGQLKPKWCPLKEMPEKRILPSWQVNNTNYGEEPWFSDGWNACIEEIER